MSRLNLDLDVLRSFVTGLELGSFAKAADRLGRSTSALSAQLKKLEDQVGVPVLRKSGRGLALTPTGEVVLSYARRLLELNDEAVVAVRGSTLSGVVRIGFQEDFGEGVLTEILGRFARAHPAVGIDARVARNTELLGAVAGDRLDLALTWESGELTAEQERLGSLPMCWIGQPALVAEHLHQGTPLPLVAFEAPCLMRSRAIEALDRAGIPWRIAFTSSSLSGIWAAVQAGLGITVRTPAGKPEGLAILNELPVLPRIGLNLNYRKNPGEPLPARLSEIVRARLDELLPSCQLPLPAKGQQASGAEGSAENAALA